MLKLNLLWLIFPLVVINTLKAEHVGVFYNTKNEQISFAAKDIVDVLAQSGFEVGIYSIAEFRQDNSFKSIVLAQVDEVLPLAGLVKNLPGYSTPSGQQSYTICTSENTNITYWVIGGGQTGTMYGGIQLSMEIKSSGFLRKLQSEGSPYIKNRGVKINIPLDSRAPSYDSDGDAAHFNVKYMWNLEYWKHYIDQLARYRYNVLSFWHPHPFTSMCKVPAYENCVLTDVMDYNGLVIKLGIDEKIAFWAKVFDHAKNRGFDIYWINWNIYAFGAVGKYGIEESPKNEQIIKYSRESLKAFLKTYPQIDGFGAHTGENFQNSTYKESVDWIYNVWAQALLDFKKDYPERQVRFIHRALYQGVPEITSKYKKFPLPWDLSFKYAVGHIYGYHQPGYIYEAGIIKELENSGKKIWLNLRNDDLYYFRWGDSEYVRNYIKSFPDKDKLIEGFYMGSDGYVWGMTHSFTDKYASFNEKPEIDKHWFNFLLWGYLGYNPEEPLVFFEEQVHNHFPGTTAQPLLKAWQAASKIFPTLTSAFCLKRDYEWYPEGCFYSKGFYNIFNFSNLKPQSGAPIYSIDEYLEIVSSKKPLTKTSPHEICETLKKYGRETLSITEKMPDTKNPELKLLLMDIGAMAYAGLYYANKVEAILNYRQNKMPEAVLSVKMALENARKYVELASEQYKDQNFARFNEGLNTGIENNKFTWEGFLEMAVLDVEYIEKMQY